MPTVTVKLSENDAELLEQLRGLGNDKKSKSEVIRDLLRSNTDVIKGNNRDEAYELLAAQLQTKDEQIAALNKSLNDALETARAAQLLQATEKQQPIAALEEEKEGEKVSRLQKIKRWFTG